MVDRLRTRCAVDILFFADLNMISQFIFFSTYIYLTFVIQNLLKNASYFICVKLFWYCTDHRSLSIFRTFFSKFLKVLSDTFSDTYCLFTFKRSFFYLILHILNFQLCIHIFSLFFETSLTSHSLLSQCSTHFHSPYSPKL